MIIAYFFDFVNSKINFFGGFMIENIKNYLWAFPCSILIIIAGIVILFKTRFFVLRKIKTIILSTVGRVRKQKKAFSLMCTSLGGTIGVGNAVGVAGAIAEGGAGALFWMAIAGLFSMAIKYAEIYFAVIHKRRSGTAGTIAYIEKATGCSLFALIYAFSCILVSLGMGNLSQIKAALSASKDVIPLSPLCLGLIMTGLFLVTALGGIKKISAFSQTAVPCFSVLYILLLSIILFKERERLPTAFESIVNSSGVFYGIKWAVIKKGISCGFSKSVFSSEAGLGSAGFSHGETDEEPFIQARWGVVEVLTDTVICLMTGLAIICVGNIPEFQNVSLVTKGVFEINFGVYGSIFYALSMVFFAFSSVICWYYIGISALSHITKSKHIKCFYTIVFSIFISLAYFISDKIIIEFSDLSNALMMLINLPALLILSKKIKTD